MNMIEHKTTPPDVVAITREAVGLEKILRQIGHKVAGGEDPEAGALVTFSGIVRATEGSSVIGHLDYDHYSGMAEREIGRLVAEARRRWPVRRIGVVHRVGPVRVGESSIVVAVSAGHRVEAFEAARFLIDSLKQTVPIWKSAPLEEGSTVDLDSGPG